MAVLNWKHHTLIQVLIAHGPLNERDFRKIFAEITTRNPSRSNERDFNDFLLNINKELSYVQMEVRCCRNQNDGLACYGLVNNVSDEQSKLGTHYTIPQIALFKAVIEAIIHDVRAKGSISTIDALNIRLESQVQTGTGSDSQCGISQVPPALRNFSMSQKEKTLDELVRDNWLCYTPEGEIGLGSRSYLELRSWFHNSGIPTCNVCNEAGVKAKVCQNESCTVRIHDYCLKNFSQSRGEIVCPSCGMQWQYQIPNSEILEGEHEQNVADQSQSSVGSRREKHRANRNVGCSTSQSSQPVSEFRRRITRSSNQTS